MAFKYILCCWALIWRGHSLASDAWAGRLSTVGVSTLPIHPVKDGAMKHWIHGPDARSIFKRDGGILNSYHQLHSQPFGEDVGKEEDRNGSTMFAQSNSALLPNAMQISTRRAAVVGMALTSLSIALLFQSEIPALAASQETPAGMGLRPASEDQPQIPFPSSANVERQQQQPILDGMIYLKNPRSERRPTASDVIVLTVRQSNDPQSAAAFAGAKIPVSRIKSFPVRFQMNVNNVILPSSLSSETPTVSQSLSQQQQKEILWTRAMTNSDLIVEAVVCSREIALDRKESLSNNSSGDMKEMCRVTGGSSPISGQGYAKLVRISRNDDNKGTNEVTIIRGPAAIRLE